MEERQARQREDLWDQLWNVLPYVLLVVAATLAALRAPARAELLITLALTGLLIVWHAWLVTAHPQWRERKLAPMAVYYVGLLALTAALVRRDPAYLLVAIGCYPMAFVALPGAWSYAGVLATSVLLAGGPTAVVRSENPAFTYGAMAAATLMAGGFGAIVRAMEREAIRRRQVNSELAAANEQLAQLRERLMDQARAAGVAEERGRLAREIHDTIAQGLAGIAMQLEAADVALEPDHPTRRRITLARDLAQRTLSEARRAVNALRPGPLESQRLCDAIADAVVDWSLQHAASAECTVTGTPRALPVDVETALLRTAQEALANAGKHSGAGRVGVTLSYMDSVVALDVRDDGIGFVPEEARDGFGLHSVRQRIASVHGNVHLETASGAGTCVCVTVPVKEEA